MAITISTIDREFSPAEVEAITGVSTALQRDWRRRGILPANNEGKWTRFSLRDLIEIMVLKTFADAGFSVKDVAEVVRIALLPAYSFIVSIPEATTWEADFEVPAAIKEATLAHAVIGAHGRYLIMVPGGTGESIYGRSARFENFDDLAAWLYSRGTLTCTILDFQRLAEHIVERAGPVMRFEATQTESSTDTPPLGSGAAGAPSTPRADRKAEGPPSS